MTISIAQGDNRLVIDPNQGGQVLECHIGNYQIIAPKTDNPLVGGWYLMAPWAGRIENNQITFKNTNYPQDINFQNWAIHGTVAFEKGQILNQQSDSVEILHYSNENWPVKAIIKQKWFVSNKFIRCSASIDVDKEFPAQLGWHPWFKRDIGNGKNAKYAIEAISQYIKTKDFVTLNQTKDIGTPPFDDAFDVPSGKGFIEWENALRIDFQFDHQTFVIYDEPEDSFCIEPQTGPPNATNYGLSIATPEAPLKASVKWDITHFREEN